MLEIKSEKSLFDYALKYILETTFYGKKKKILYSKIGRQKTIVNLIKKYKK